MPSDLADGDRSNFARSTQNRAETFFRAEAIRTDGPLSCMPGKIFQNAPAVRISSAPTRHSEPVWLRLAMTASTAEMATAETAVESTTGMREHWTIMKPGPPEAVGAERVPVKAVVIKVALMMEAVPPITPIWTAVVVSVARIPVGSVIAGAFHTSSQANHRDKEYGQQNWF